MINISLSCLNATNLSMDNTNRRNRSILAVAEGSRGINTSEPELGWNVWRVKNVTDDMPKGVETDNAEGAYWKKFCI